MELNNLPKITGHRGAAASAPENTLASIRYAADHGVRWIEIDVMATLDDKLVVHHDLKLGRCNNGAGEVAAKSLAEIERLDAGSWFSDEFATEKVPSLKAALELIGALGLGLNLEIKAPVDQGARTAELVVQHLAKHRPRNMALLISSFRPEALDRIHALAPEIPLGVLSNPVPEDWQARLTELDAFSLHCEAPNITADAVKAVKAAGYRVLAYTVNDAVEAGQLLNMGVDSIISDCPDRLKRDLDI